MNLLIPVPGGSHSLVKAGQKIDFGQPFIEKKTLTDFRVPIANILSIPPTKIFNYLKKFVDEEVKKGDIIALKKNIFSTKTVASEYEGKIKEIDHNEGCIIISSGSKKNSIPAYFKGEIVQIKNNAITVKVKNGKEVALKKCSGDFGGEVFYQKDEMSAAVSSVELTNKVLVAESISSYFQHKAETLGIKGYITLITLSEETALNTAQFKNIDDFKNIVKQKYPYCLIDQKFGKIYFYDG